MKKVLIVNANYYKDISQNLVNSSKLILKRNKVKISRVNVPGIFELPLIIKKI